MADIILPRDLPEASSVSNSVDLIIDTGAFVQKAKPQQIVDAARPVATEAQAEAGTDNVTIMTPLRVAQAIQAAGPSGLGVDAEDVTLADGTNAQQAFDASSISGYTPATFQAKIERLRAAVNERRAIAAPQAYNISAPLTAWGQFSANGAMIDGARSSFQVDSNFPALEFGSKVGSIASSYYSKLDLSNFSFRGSGKADGATGVFQRVSAGNNIYNIRSANIQYGFDLLGGLSSNYYSISAETCSIGLRARFHDGSDGLSVMAPNANSFFGSSFRTCDQAIDYQYSPATAINFFGGVWEANNYPSGTASDGKKVFNFENAGHVNLIGIHSESNRGQYGYYYNATDTAKKLLMMGNCIIDNTGTLVHVERGSLTSIASRINNSESTHDIYLNTGAYATLIDTECRAVGGDASHVVGIRYGRLMVGGNPLAGSAPITVNSAAISGTNIAADFRNDVVQIRLLNTAGTRVGYIQSTATGDHALNNDNTAGGWAIRAANSARFYVGRLGAMTIEPGSDNTISCGSPTFRFSQVYAASATINTSDAREKQQVRPLSDAERAVAVRVKGLIRAFKWNDAVELKGDDARWHFGVIAQEVVEAFEAEGLNPFEYGAVCYDEWEDQVETWPDEYDDVNGEKVLIKKAGSRVTKAAGNRYGVRYQELLAFVISAL